MPVDQGVDISDLAKRTPGFSGADLAHLTREAGLRVCMCVHVCVYGCMYIYIMCV